MPKQKHKYLPSGTLLFDDDNSDIEDEDPPRFRSRIPHIPPKETSKRVHQTTAQKIKEIENKTLEAAQRSLNVLRETQDIGINAATELVSQGEKLQNVNMKLDEINSNLKQSQKDINGIKSVFFGIKNYISGSRSPSPHRRHASPQKQNKILGKSKFYDTTDSPHKTVSSHCTEPPGRSMQTHDIQPGGSSSQVDSILEKHLQEMAIHLTQLKGIGKDLGKEIDHQNVLIDTLNDKIEQADIKIGKQNKDMNNILGK